MSGVERGSTLVEALVALLVVGATVAGAHGLHRAALRAQARAEVTLALLILTSSAVERARVGAPPALLAGQGDADGGAVLHEVPSEDPAWWPATCDAGSGLRRLRVSARDDTSAIGASAPGSSVAIDALVPSSRPPELTLLIGPSVAAPVTGAVTVGVRTVEGTVTTATADPDGCVRIPLAGGPLRVLLPTGDGSAGSGLDVPGVLALPLRTDLGSEGDLAVDIVPGDGAVAPDGISGGAIGWWLADDPARRIVSGGAMRVAAGQHVIVVGACGDARAGGATVGVVVPPGASTVVAVALPTVEVPTALATPGRRLVVQRDRPCPGTALRPAMTWDLAGGMLRAAVPDGRWQVRLEAADGRVVAGPVTVDLAGDDRVVPPW